MRTDDCSCLFRRPPLDGQDLIDNLLDRQVALPAFQAARAKPAAVGAAHLRRNTEGVAIAGVAVKRRIGGNEHAFNQRAVLQPPKKLLGGVPRTLLADQGKGMQRIMLTEFIPQALRQAGHRLPTRGVMPIYPFQQLVRAIGRLAPLPQPGDQFLARQRFDVANHATSVSNRRKLSMNLLFGVPASAGSGRLKAGLRTYGTIQAGSWSQ